MLSYNRPGIDFEDFVERMNAIKDAIEAVSGGGFNYERYYSTDGKDILMMSNYDYMDENGSYDAVIGYQILIDIKTADFRISLTPQNTSHAKYVYHRENLKEFFEDTYAMALADFSRIATYTVKTKAYSA